ncbi:MAG: condensation domain-containing protein, partial [Planctomycetaceae bacterium]|nr:condensation domain-containing protein [Planctomycetaceae bacterium]
FSEKTDIEKLASAVKTAISAHPLLTARLVKNGDNYAWQRNNNATITIETVNQINDEELAQEEKTFICPFNLMSGGLLFRSKIYKTLSSVVMLFDIHHSIMDGFSQKILLEDIAAAYRGEKVASERQPTALTAGLKEQEQLVSSDVDDKCNELVRRIKSCGDLTKLPEQKQLDKPAGGTKFHSGKLLSAESINAFCKANNVSPNSVYMSSFVKAVSSHCGISDVLFLFITVGRDKVNPRAVGAFIKTIPIVVTHDKNKSAVENCRAAESAIKLSTQCAHEMLIKNKQSSKPEWGKLPDLSKPLLLYIFHGNLADNNQNPFVEDKRFIHSFIQSSVGENSIPFIPLEFIAMESQGSYNHLCKYNDALFDEKFIAQFVNEIETNIEQLITEQQNAATRYRLSDEQEKYYMYSLNAGGMYMMPTLLKFASDINVYKLADAFNQTVNSHRFIKANIQIFDGKPYWKKQDGADIIPVNIRNVTQKELTDLLNRLIDRKEFHPNPLNDPLYFAEIYVVDGDAVYLLMAFHHIYYDGITRNILIKNILELYAGQSIQPDNGNGINEGNEEFIYRNSQSFASSEQFYAELFQHYSGTLNLNLSSSRKENLSESDIIKTQDSQILESKNLSKKRESETVDVFVSGKRARQFCSSNEISLNVLFLTGLCYAVNKFIGGEYVFFSTETAGRIGRQLDNDVGLFVRCFPAGIRLNRSLTPLELLLSVKEQYYCILKNHTAFTVNLAAEKFGFCSNFNYLFQADIYAEKPAVSNLTYDDLTYRIPSNFFEGMEITFDCDVQIYNFDLLLHRNDDRYMINFRYDAALYSKSLIKSFAEIMRSFIEELYR